MAYVKLLLSGTLPRDAEMRELSSGDKVISFVLPLPKPNRNEERTYWVECTYWRKSDQSTNVLDLLKKGATVLVEGRLYVREYVRRDNTPGFSLTCRIDQLNILVYADKKEAPAPAAEEPTSPDFVPLESNEDNDLPF
ncbi:MAG: single-stranded DNA-binding protein [Bacteroidia bacterium]